MVVRGAETEQPFQFSRWAAGEWYREGEGEYGWVASLAGSGDGAESRLGRNGIKARRQSASAAGKVPAQRMIMGDYGGEVGGCGDGGWAGGAVDRI